MQYCIFAEILIQRHISIRYQQTLVTKYHLSEYLVKSIITVALWNWEGQTEDKVLREWEE